MSSELIELGRQMVNETGHYAGGNLRDFEKVGRQTFQTLLANGLLPSHRVLDFGCGSLRNGYWLMRFLDRGNYYGIEPVEKGVRGGLKHLIGAELEAFKQPSFRYNNDCDMGAFGVSFDYVVARSILSHACPGMLHKILASFARSSPQGALFASYWRLDMPAPVRWWQRRRRYDPMVTRYQQMAVDTSRLKEQEVYAVGDNLPDDDMRFIQIITYSLDRIQAIADTHGLCATEDWTFHPINQQIWLKFTAKAA